MPTVNAGMIKAALRFITGAVTSGGRVRGDLLASASDKIAEMQTIGATATEAVTALTAAI